MFGTQNYGGGFTQQGGASYRPQQAQQQSAESLSLDDVMQGGAPSAFSKDDPIGTSVEGEIVEIRAEQQTDFTTGEPLYYPNGKAKPQVVIHLQTSLQDPDRVGDSGIRGVYVKGYNIGQLRLACRQAGVGDHPNVGDRLKATFARTQPAKTRGYNDAKIYDYVVTPKKQSDLSAAMNDPQAGQQQYAPQQPQQSAYGQPTTIGQPAGLTASDRQTISQLAAAGKTAQEIAGLLGERKPMEMAQGGIVDSSHHQRNGTCAILCQNFGTVESLEFQPNQTYIYNYSNVPLFLIYVFILLFLCCVYRPWNGTLDGTRQTRR